MNFKEFADKIVEKFPPDEKEIERDKNYLVDWVKAISLDGEFDYERAFYELMRSYSYKTLPSAQKVTDILKFFKIKQNYQKCPKFTSIWADKGELTYEFGIEETEEKTRKELIKMGFKNIRMQRSQNSLF